MTTAWTRTTATPCTRCGLRQRAAGPLPPPTAGRANGRGGSSSRAWTTDRRRCSLRCCGRWRSSARTCRWSCFLSCSTWRPRCCSARWRRPTRRRRRPSRRLCSRRTPSRCCTDGPATFACGGRPARLLSLQGLPPPWAARPLGRYLFNPYNVAACVGTSPTLLANLLCQFGLYYGQNGAAACAHTRRGVSCGAAQHEALRCRGPYAHRPKRAGGRHGGVGRLSRGVPGAAAPAARGVHRAAESRTPPAQRRTGKAARR